MNWPLNMKDLKWSIRVCNALLILLAKKKRMQLIEFNFSDSIRVLFLIFLAIVYPYYQQSEVTRMTLFGFIEQASSDLRIPTDILKIIIAFITTLILSPLYRVITGKTGRNWLSIILGSALLFFMVEEWSIFVILGMILTYLLMRVSSRPFLVGAVCSSLLLLAVHSYRFIFSYIIWAVDCSVYIMILVTKLTYYGKWLEQKEDRKEISFESFMAYNLFFPSVLTGPTFSYEIFQAFISDSKKGTLRTLNLVKALKPMLYAIPISFITVYFISQFSTTWVLQSQFYLGLPIWQKILVLLPLGIFYRAKYQSAWTISQVNINLSGLSQSPTGSYDLVTSFDMRFQIQSNLKVKTDYWNTSIQIWLKNVVYQPLSGKINSTLAMFATFFISACWHGLYLTYYLTFGLWAVLIHITKWLYKWSQVLPKKITNSKLYALVTFIGSASIFNTVGMISVILNWEGAIQFHADLNYSALIVMGVGLVLSFVLKPPSTKKVQKQE